MEEVEQVLDDPQRKDASESSGLPIWFGWTRTGRYIAVVFDWIDPITVYPVTAYEPHAE